MERSLPFQSDPWNCVYNQYKILDFWEISKLLHIEENSSDSSPESLKHDDELNRMVARVVSDGALDQDEEADRKEDEKTTDKATIVEGEQAQFSFDDECEKLKNLLRKSKESYEDEFVGSVSAFYSRDSSASAGATPTSSFDSGCEKRRSSTDAPVPTSTANEPMMLNGNSCIKDDTLIVLSERPTDEDITKTSVGFNPITSSQLFAGAPLFAFPSAHNVRVDAFDDFRRNGHDAGSPSPFYASVSAAELINGGASNPWSNGRASRSALGGGGDGDALGPESGAPAKAFEEKGFSWATITKSKGVENKVDVAAEQRFCRILEKFIEEFKCTYEEARALLELMQMKQLSCLSAAPLSLVVDAARDLFSQSPEAATQSALAAEREIHAKRAAVVDAKQANQTVKAMALLKEEELPWNYKTVMCNFFKEGTCRLGNKCMFAHSKAELREPIIPNGYCIAFVTKGVCKWGSTCNYIHEIPSLSKKQTQPSEKIKLIKAQESKGPHIPVGLNYVTSTVRPIAAATPSSVSVALTPPTTTTTAVSSVQTAFNGVPIVKRGDSPTNSSSDTKGKNKNKLKEKEEWSTVSRGAKQVKSPEAKSPAALVNAFVIDSLCVLCREQVSASNNRIKLECGHSEFHRGCIKEWLRTRSPSTCPICRVASKAPSETEEAAVVEAVAKKKK